MKSKNGKRKELKSHKREQEELEEYLLSKLRSKAVATHWKNGRESKNDLCIK